MFFKLGSIVGAIAVLLSSSIVNAQDAERYITVGHDKVGNHIALDTETIKGTTYKLYGMYGDGIFETTFSASCQESRLFLNNITIYGTSGQIIQQERNTGEIPFVAASSPGKAMQIVCQRMGVRGW
ncbi:hypothetical protein IQ243_24460 [Nostocales cyanobacterium LEGE 11386]|jgi:hypothetical protein|nr:hypothetical protein [Nostocales cyanobacterium LEGE 11386]MBW4556854.1 hypothetical protein [Trichormus sp. ATA11-4-KO1]